MTPSPETQALGGRILGYGRDRQLELLAGFAVVGRKYGQVDDGERRAGSEEGDTPRRVAGLAFGSARVRL